MLFGNLTRIVTHERNHLRFMRSREDRSILVAIGQAMEAGEPIGYKQLALMEVASPLDPVAKAEATHRCRRNP